MVWLLIDCLHGPTHLCVQSDKQEVPVRNTSDSEVDSGMTSARVDWKYLTLTPAEVSKSCYMLHGSNNFQHSNNHCILWQFKCVIKSGCSYTLWWYVFGQGSIDNFWAWHVYVEVILFPGCLYLNSVILTSNVQRYPRLCEYCKMDKLGQSVLKWKRHLC